MTGISAKCYVPCLRDVRDSLEGRPKVGGVEETNLGRNPNVTSDSRMDRNLVW